MTDRLGFYIWPALAILAGCATMARADVATQGQPPAALQGEINTLVEWRTRSGAYLRCAQIQAQFGHVPLGAHGCAYAQEGGRITLVLPMDLHPLIVHELGHAHQLQNGERVDHKGWK